MPRRIRKPCPQVHDLVRLVSHGRDGAAVTDRSLQAGATLPTLDRELAASWVTVAHQVKREIQARLVGTLVSPRVGQNYYSLQLVPRDGTGLRLMLNAAVRLVACSADRDSFDVDLSSTPFDYVPRPDLFTMAGFLVADPHNLERPITSDELAELGPDELQDVTYHGATRLGDVLFNWFD